MYLVVGIVTDKFILIMLSSKKIVFASYIINMISKDVTNFRIIWSCTSMYAVVA